MNEEVIIDFARRLDLKRLGFAFCLGLLLMTALLAGIMGGR